MPNGRTRQWRRSLSVSHHEEFIMETLAENLGLQLQSIMLGAENLRLRREAKALHEINKEISRLADLDSVLENITEKACYLLKAENCYIALADEKAQILHVRVNYTTRSQVWRTWAFKYHPGESSLLRADGYIMRWHHLTYPYGEGVGGLVAQNLSSLLIRNSREFLQNVTASVPEKLATGGIAAAIAVPMCTKRGLIGVLCAASCKNNAFNRAQLKLMETLGNQAAIAIENAHNFTEQKALAKKLRNSIATHERLLSLVLANQGIQAIADTLANLIGNPVVIQDQEEQVAYLAGGTEMATGVPYVRAPIVAGKSLYGYVTAFAVHKPITEEQRAAVEEASIVLALEYLKQDAARAGLLQHVITAQEEERKRIARELHDETSQTLTALMLGLDTLGLLLHNVPAEAISRLRALKSLAEGMLNNIHRIISDLRPSLLDDLGLFHAINWCCEQRLKPVGIKYETNIAGLEQRFPSPVETALYRIVQEAITNIIRHAKATEVAIDVAFDKNQLILRVEDNGCGFEKELFTNADSSSKSLGLWGMKERVNALKGTIDLETSPGCGTVITVTVPVAEGIGGEED